MATDYESNMPPKLQNGSGDKKTIENIYQKKTQLEHILLRPDTYIGSVELTKETTWVYNQEDSKMIQKEISYVPGLYKIFDEILVNAADNKQRDPKMNCIKVDINIETNTISVWNNGMGIPVVMHKEEKMYVPSMIFGHLLTSSNYNDEEQKVTGGRNGYGAKLCNIFSEKFSVQTASRKERKQFKQVWKTNMTKTSEPKVESYSGEDFTKITFEPDLSKFKMEKLDEDIVSLMSRRAFDIAASTRGVSVFLNGTKLPVKSFKDYVDLYLKDKSDDCGLPYKVIFDTPHQRWEVGLTISDRGFQQVSFVNSIATMKGGRHVDYVVDMIVKQLLEICKKKNKGGITLKPFQIKNHMWIFINCLIVNPTFDSQTKENMTLQTKNFGSKCTLTDKFIKSVVSSGLVETILTWAKFKAQTDLAKTSGKKNTKLKNMAKLEDANEAGSKTSHLCTLILTEGDSAKTLVTSGFSVVGRDRFGVFPLRGKLLNVREATHKQILENAEINNLIKIIGLQYKKKYLTEDDIKSLRYGRVMIMTDQDQDGSHIKGLLINFIHTNWPELLRLPFLEEFITPIVKATKGNNELSFYSLPEFEEWKQDTPNSSTFKVKYYKGLGTSTSIEAKEYFENMDRHRILFKYEGVQDDESIVMAFAKKTVDQRKEWLTKHMEESKERKILGLPERYLYTKSTKAITYSEFVNLELILFSNADNIRSIPCSVDGLKPGQRKVLFTCIKRNDKSEIKVAQLAGSVGEKSAYHHGEASLCSTIVKLAQNYVGSNNINLLQPRGQFGTRLSGGNDSASPRYIFTLMSQLTRLIFHPLDDPLLEYQVDDNLRIEPVWYIPIIPMALVNGAEGIGTGWSTKIPNFNPRDLIANIRRLLQDDEIKPMHPFYKNFQGSIELVADKKYVSNGNVGILGQNKIEITELPIGTWTQTYKESVLEPLLHGNEKNKPLIADYKEYHTDTTVRFVVTFSAGEFETIKREPGGFHKLFKLVSTINLGQMNAFDYNNCLKRYDTPSELLQEYYTLRLEYYEKRKVFLVGQMEAEAKLLTNQARFILEKCNKTLIVENKKRKVMVDELIAYGFDVDPVLTWKEKCRFYQGENSNEDDEDEEEEEEESKPTSKAAPSKKKPVDSEKAFEKLVDVKKFNYLLGMSLWWLTEEKKNQLLKQRDTKLAELAALKAITPKSMWATDLDALEKKMDQVEEKERRDELGSNMKQKASASTKMEKGATKRKKMVQVDEIYPSKNAQKVKFVITSEILKKFETIAKTAATAKVKKEKGSDPKPLEADEFDALVDAGDSKVKAAAVVVKKEVKPKKEVKAKKDDPKQTKLNFAPKPRGKKKNSDDEDLDLDNSDAELPEISVPARERVGRRAATKKINYSFLLDDDEEDDDNKMNSDDDSEVEMFDNSAIKEPSKATATIDLSDSESGGGDDDDDKANSADPNKSSDDLFNTLKSETEKAPTKSRGKPKKPTESTQQDEVKKRPRKKIVNESSEDESVDRKRPTKKKKAISSDSDSDFDF